MLILGKDYYEAEQPHGESPCTDGETLEETELQEESLPGMEAVGLLANAEEGERAKPWHQKIIPFIKKYRKQAIISASVLVIGLAVYLNWYLYAGEKAPKPESASAGEQAGAEQVGEVDAVDYFSVSVINRQRARDEAVEVLQGVVDASAEASPEREEALAGISEIASCIEQEAAIETLIKSKGFAACVAVIADGKASVVVQSDGLLENEIAQIQEIVFENAGILPVNLKIIEH